MRRFWRWFALLAAAIFFCASLEVVLRERAKASVLQEALYESMDFRKQALSTELYEELVRKAPDRAGFSALLTASMLNGGFRPRSLSGENSAYLRYKRREFYGLQRSYEAIWCDVACFPVAGEGISYEDTFGAKRTYGGERLHEGTDLFGEKDISGYYPVLSMTDGVVEQVGWLPLGGYRIGIRAPGGAYFYYAHLSQYEKEFERGDGVSAGDILGYMGNTGYGSEGTVGKFPVHLHLGIYISTEKSPELGVNPYWVLKAAEKNIRKYRY